MVRGSEVCGGSTRRGGSAISEAGSKITTQGDSFKGEQKTLDQLRDCSILAQIGDN